MEAVHVAVTRQVKPGYEKAFEEALREFARESLRQPGTTGVHLIAPVPGTDGCEYGILRSFVSELHFLKKLNRHATIPRELLAAYSIMVVRSRSRRVHK